MIHIIITSSRANKSVTTKAIDNTMDLVCKTSEINPLLSVSIDSVNYLTHTTEKTMNRDCVTTSVAAKESNLIDSLLFYPSKAKSAIITHKSQTGANMSNSCLSTNEIEEVTNDDLMVNKSKIIDSDDLCGVAMNRFFFWPGFTKPG